MDIKNKIINTYKNSVKHSLSGIRDALEETSIELDSIFANCSDILAKTSSFITDKWTTGKKYIRTEYVIRALADIYPTSVIETSVTVDAQVNILDDLFDETLSAEQKQIYVVELLRAISVYSSTIPNKKIQKALSFYFLKLITLAVSEKKYMEKVKKEKNFEKIVNLSADLLLCRAFDIDIFVEIPFSKFDNEKVIKEHLKVARVFRSLNILKKDILDLERDVEQGQETLVTSMVGPYFSKYVKSLTKKLKEHSDNLKICSEINKSDISKRFFDNFFLMIEEEIKQVDENMKKSIKSS